MADVLLPGCSVASVRVSRVLVKYYGMLGTRAPAAAARSHEIQLRVKQTLPEQVASGYY